MRFVNAKAWIVIIAGVLILVLLMFPPFRVIQAKGNWLLSQGSDTRIRVAFRWVGTCYLVNKDGEYVVAGLDWGRLIIFVGMVVVAASVLYYAHGKRLFAKPSRPRSIDW